MGDILLFPGQGSTVHFSDRDGLNRVLEELGEDRQAFDNFVQECRDAFREDYDSIPSNERETVGDPDDLQQVFRDNASFLVPPPRLQSHPVFETLTLYFRQILELALYQARNDSPGQPIETAGVCTGVLPAILAATSSAYLSPQFFKTAIHGSRLAFWIGLRVSQFCQHAAGDQWKSRPWALSVFGLPVEALQERMNKYLAELVSNGPT